MQGIKHLVECQCILPQYKKDSNPPFHKFVVFSVIDDSDEVIEKFSQCNNCGIIHRVFDLCKSEIAVGHESLNSLPRIEDFKLMLPSSVVNVLDNYNAEIYTWEQAAFIINYEKVNESIILSSDEVKGKLQGKKLVYKGNSKFAIEPFVTETEI